jgi:hypothetical protein
MKKIIISIISSVFFIEAGAAISAQAACIGKELGNSCRISEESTGTCKSSMTTGSSQILICA